MSGVIFKLTIDKLERLGVWIQRGVSHQKVLVQRLSDIISEVTNCVNSSGFIIQLYQAMVFHLVGVKAYEVPGGIADGLAIEGNCIVNVYPTVDDRRTESVQLRRHKKGALGL